MRQRCLFSSSRIVAAASKARKSQKTPSEDRSEALGSAVPEQFPRQISQDALKVYCHEICVGLFVCEKDNCVADPD